MTKTRLPYWLDRFQPSETAVLFGTAIGVGAGTGLGAVLFINLIALVQRALFQGGEAALGFLGSGLFILVPAVGGLLAGPIIAFFAKEAKGHGVPEVMQAIALRGGRIRPRSVVAKVIASAHAVNVSAVFNPTEFVVRVRDDGKGFAAPERVNDLAASGHCGLMGMQERAELLGGQLTIASSPGAGTTIELRLRL